MLAPETIYEIPEPLSPPPSHTEDSMEAFEDEEPADDSALHEIKLEDEIRQPFHSKSRLLPAPPLRLEKQQSCLETSPVLQDYRMEIVEAAFNKPCQQSTKPCQEVQAMHLCSVNSKSSAPIPWKAEFIR